jgi:type VI secretion system VasD/TssJ family lipoprotein
MTKGLLILIAMILLCSCSKTVIPPRWEYEKDAIRLYYKSSPQLNFYRGSSHTLSLCVYFLENPNDFNQVMDEKGGLEKLCDCTKFAPSVTNTKRLIINPNKDDKEFLDRPTNAKYVGIAAGYYELQKESIIRLYPVPIAEEKSMSKITQKPGILKIEINLGPQKIQ